MFLSSFSFSVNELSEKRVTHALLGAIIDGPKDVNVKCGDAPRVIRSASLLHSGISFKGNIFSSSQLVDLGDFSDLKTIENVIHEVLSQNIKVMLIGGDHLSSLASGRAVARTLYDLKTHGLVWLDAHLDLVDTYPGTHDYSHATVLKRLIDEKAVNPQNIWVIGAHSFAQSDEEIKLARELNINVVLPSEFRKNNKSILSRISREFETIHLSFDLDVIGMEYAPGVSTPEPFGLTPIETLDIINNLKKKVIMFDVVELAPENDIRDVTTRIATNTIFNFLT